MILLSYPYYKNISNLTFVLGCVCLGFFASIDALDADPLNPKESNSAEAHFAQEQLGWLTNVLPNAADTGSPSPLPLLPAAAIANIFSFLNPAVGGAAQSILSLSEQVPADLIHVLEQREDYSRVKRQVRAMVESPSLQCYEG